MQPNQPIEPNSPQPNNNQVPNNAGVFPPNPQQPTQPTNPTQYNAQPPQVNQPLNTTGGVQTPNKILPLKWIPVIIFFVIIFDVIGKFSRVAEFGLILLLGIVVWPFVSKIKSKPTEAIDNQELNKAILLMSIDPIIAQAVYYYRLRKTQPSKANFYNKLGWRVVIIQLIFIIGIAIVIAAIAAPKVIKTAETQAATNSSIAANGGQYVDSQGRFKITLPSGWSSETPSSNQLAEFAGPADSDGQSPVINVFAQSSQGQSLAAYVSSGEASEAQTYQNYQKIGQDQSETIDGMPAELLTFSGEVGGQSATNMQLVLVDSANGEIYGVTGASPSSIWSQNQSAIQKSLLSFIPQ